MTVPDLPPGGVKARPGTPTTSSTQLTSERPTLSGGWVVRPRSHSYIPGSGPSSACVPHVDFRPHRNTLELADTSVSRQHWFRRS